MQPSISKLMLFVFKQNFFADILYMWLLWQNFNMVKFFVAVLALVVFSINSFSQTDPQLLKNLNKVLDATKINDFETTLDYTCPQIFTLASREELLAVLEQSFNAADFKMVITDIKIDTIFPPFLHDNQKHVVVKYKMGMNMIFTEAKDSSFWNLMVGMMDGQFGPNSTKALPEKNTLEIKTNSRMVAIKKDDQTDWCLFNYDSAKGLAEMVLGNELVKKIETYK